MEESGPEVADDLIHLNVIQFLDLYIADNVNDFLHEIASLDLESFLLGHLTHTRPAVLACR